MDEKTIKKYDNFQEQLWGGLSIDYKFYESEDWELSTTIQATVYHEGGQIDTIDKDILILLNTANGLKAQKNINAKYLKSISLDGHFLFYKDFTYGPTRFEYPFSQGTAWYFNLFARSKIIDIMLSSWYGNNFATPIGGYLYQGVSSSVVNPNYFEKQRQIILLRLMKDIKIYKNIYATYRFTPFHDFENKRTDFFHSFYINYSQDFFLKKFKYNEVF